MLLGFYHAGTEVYYSDDSLNHEIKKSYDDNDSLKNFTLNPFRLRFDHSHIFGMTIGCINSE